MAPPLDPLGYCLYPALMRPGNAVRLLRDGVQTYPAMLEAIAGASRTVHLETYILHSDRTGRRFAETLSEAARRGVRVRLLYDAVGSFGLDAGFVKRLADSGVEAHAYRPLRLASLLREGHLRDHRKILSVDGRIGFAGGLNIGDEYAPMEEGGGGWRDNHLRVEGPAAAALDAEFLFLWNRETAQSVAAPPPAPPAGGAPAGVLANRRFSLRYRIRAAYLHAIRRAERTIEITNAYFIPDRGMRRALRKAAARGVQVRLLLPAHSDVPPVIYASRHLYAKFLKAGVRIFEYARGISHCRSSVVDRVWCAAGSYNIDHRSLFHNLELDVHVADAELGRAMGESFEADLARAREVAPDEWRRRSRLERLRDRIAYVFRRWL